MNALMVASVLALSSSAPAQTDTAPASSAIQLPEMHLCCPAGQSVTLRLESPPTASQPWTLLEPPRHGRLSGTAPELTYTAGQTQPPLPRGPVLFVEPNLWWSQVEKYDPQRRKSGSGRYRAFKTLAGAAQAAAPGDTVLIRGGTYEEALCPARSGTPGHPITFRAYGVDDPLTFRSSTAAGESVVARVTVHVTEPVVITGGMDVDPAIQISGRDHLVIEGLHVEKVKRWLHAVGSNHNTIQYCTFTRAMHPNGSSKTGLFFQDATGNRILNNVISHSTQDNVSLVRADRNLIAANRITDAAHALWVIKCGNFNIVRDNYFHNQKQKIGEVYDCHAAGFDHDCFAYNATHHNLIEGNIFAYTPARGNRAPATGIQYAGQDGIIRRNVFYQITGPALDLTLYQHEATYNTGNHIFHNVLCDSQFAGLRMSSEQRFPFAGQQIKNNIIAGSRFVAHDKRWSRFTRILDNQPIQILTTGLEGFFLENNCLWADAVAGDPYFFTHGERKTPRNSPARPLEAWQTGRPDLFQGNIETDPKFLDRARHDYQLADDSPLVDAGAFLTRTVQAGEGDCMAVADAGYFCDGFGIPGEQGDWIQLQGETQPARIIAVDYAANRLKLDRPLRWRENQGVALRYAGSAPDIGAHEHGLLPSPPRSGQPQQPSPPGGHIVLTPAAVDLGASSSTATVQVHNLVVSPVNVAADQPWLNAKVQRMICSQAEAMIRIDADRSGLSAGSHAGQVRLQAAGQPALTVEVRLIVPPCRDVPLIAPGDEWRYLKGDKAPPANWNALEADDSRWPSGPTGIGYSSDIQLATTLDDMNGKYVSFYARRSFQIEDPTRVVGLSLGMIYDDGFVAFINGREILRSPGFASPAVELRHTLRSGSKHDDEAPETIFAIPLTPGLLHPGKNVLAIEVHNEYKKSSDACMIPRLLARIASPQGEPTTAR